MLLVEPVVEPVPRERPQDEPRQAKPLEFVAIRGPRAR
jgi:hypothetical protein